MTKANDKPLLTTGFLDSFGRAMGYLAAHVIRLEVEVFGVKTGRETFKGFCDRLRGYAPPIDTLMDDEEDEDGE